MGNSSWGDLPSEIVPFIARHGYQLTLIMNCVCKRWAAATPAVRYHSLDPHLSYPPVNLERHYHTEESLHDFEWRMFEMLLV